MAMCLLLDQRLYEMPAVRVCKDHIRETMAEVAQRPDTCAKRLLSVTDMASLRTLQTGLNTSNGAIKVHAFAKAVYASDFASKTNLKSASDKIEEALVLVSEAALTSSYYSDGCFD